MHSAEAQSAERAVPARRASIVRVLLIYAAAVAVFQIVFVAWIAPSGAFRAYLEWIARLSAIILRILGYEAEVLDTRVSAGGVGVQVVSGCAGVQPIALYVLALVALPCGAGWKLRGAVVGGLVLFVLNIVRIVSLTILEMHDPSAAKTWHLTLWPMLLIVTALGLWIAVARRALRGGS